MDNPAEKILDRLREKGWIKGRLGTAGGPNCMAGAGLFQGLKCKALILSIIREQYPDRSTFPEWEVTIPSFNDHPDTTFADVERVLEKAAGKWEEERVING